MGCDGGTIPTRDELVRLKKKPEQKDKTSELAFRWRHCAISQQELQMPIVGCELGRLYNKEVVLETLIDKSSIPDVARHIRTLKDIKELNLTENPSYKESAGTTKGDGYVDHQMAHYICPVIGLEMNGKFKFSFLWGCGCVISERAIKEVKSAVCHKCQRPFREEDVITLNASGDDLDLMETHMEARRARAKMEKKAQKEAKKKSRVESRDVQDDSALPSSSKMAKLEMTVEDKKQKLNGTLNGTEPGSSKLFDPSYSKTRSEYSIAHDPKASEAYKSLFTSHQRARKQEKAHWITYNPFYN